MKDKGAPRPLIFLVAGEPSGDALGGALMAALTAKSQGTIRFAGVGGPEMIRNGLDSLFPMDQLAIMGMAEVVRHIPRVRRLIDRTAHAIAAMHPDAVITIDSPAFTKRVAKKIKPLGIPIIHYVAPTVWAWRPGRARKVADIFDHLITLLPFEAPHFERHGLSCSYVGYPAVEKVKGGDGQAFRNKHRIGAGDILLCAMPGSRKSEVHRLMPIFAETVGQLSSTVPNLKVAIPTIPNVAAQVREQVQTWPVPVVLVEEPDERRNLMAAADIALVKSGTSAVELAAAKVPTVITQKLSYLSVAVFLALVRVPFVSIVNLMANEELQLERLQHRCTPKVLSEALVGLLADKDGTAARVAKAYAIAAELGAEGVPPSEKAAEAVLGFLRRDRSSFANAAASAPPDFETDGSRARRRAIHA
ncbi:MAG TPA: lipid-A-disaccharide synthase [Methyloceanibacter sp.]|nr:lipid-A-disaccharide synthase [Methyloceanibacter sp.]